MTLRPVVSALFVVLLAMMAASENVWGAAAASTVARASIVQVSATEDAVMRVRSIKEIKFQRAFQRTTHQQYDFSCGSAAVATLLTFQYGRPTDESSVFKAMFVAGDQAQPGFAGLMTKITESPPHSRSFQPVPELWQHVLVALARPLEQPVEMVDFGRFSFFLRVIEHVGHLSNCRGTDRSLMTSLLPQSIVQFPVRVHA